MDLTDIALEAAADVEEMMREFELDAAKPQMKVSFAKLWREMSDEAKEQFKKEKPDAYHALMESLK